MRAQPKSLKALEQQWEAAQQRAKLVRKKIAFFPKGYDNSHLSMVWR